MSHARARENVRGAMAMLGAIGLFIVNDAMIKLASEGLPAAQTIVRGIFATTWIILAVFASGLRRQVHHALERRTLGRAMLDVASTFTYLIALFNMPMALAVAIGQTAPLMMLMLSVLFLGEHVPWNRWVAMLVGFAAVLLVAHPGSDGFTWWAALSLLATLCSAMRDIYTRVVPQRVPSLIITLASAVAVTLAATALTAAAGWRPMTVEQWGLLFGASLFLAGAYHLMIVAMRLGEVSFVGGFRYASLPAGALVAWFVWGQLPDGPAMIGMAVIVAAGLYLFRTGRPARTALRSTG
jgi:drug/metabolite transporter (DMT)-like permease